MDVRRELARLKEQGERVDYITFVPDGEPTLDSRLADQLKILKPLGVPLAVITNSSLLSREDVRRDLGLADRVSVKIDAVRHDTWRRIDRPHGSLRLEEILDGILEFSRVFKGELDSETMLVDGINDSLDDLRPLSAFLEALQPDRAYLSIPIRPPADESVTAPDEAALVRAYDTLSESVSRVEMLAGLEGSTFVSTGDVRADLLAITAVHPMRSDQVQALLEQSGATWDVVEWLVRQGKLREVLYNDRHFITRRLSTR